MVGAGGIVAGRDGEDQGRPRANGGSGLSHSWMGSQRVAERENPFPPVAGWGL